jgi:hypothetical protein
MTIGDLDMPGTRDLARGTRLKHLSIGLLIMAGLSPPRGALAQHRDSLPSHRWEVSVTLGQSVGPAMWNMEHALEAGDFGDDLCLVFCIEEPRHHLGRRTVRVAAGYALRPRVRVRLELLWADLGTAEGYRAPFIWLNLRPAARTVALSVVAGDMYRLGAGPALQIVDLLQSDGSGEPWRRHSRLVRPGLLLSGSLVTTTGGRLFGTAALEAVLTGPATVGPFVARDNSGGLATLPAHRIQLSYVTARVGVGLRL